MLLETGIFISHALWLFRTRKLRKQAKLAGQSFDDLPEARAYQTRRSEKKEGIEIPSIDVEKGAILPQVLPQEQTSLPTCCPGTVVRQHC